MDLSLQQKLSCKACQYATSELLAFLRHVRTFHYECHASKADLSVKAGEMKRECDMNSTGCDTCASALKPGGVSSLQSKYLTDFKEDVFQSPVKNQGSSTNQLSSRASTDQKVSVKREATDTQSYGISGEFTNDNDNSNGNSERDAFVGDPAETSEWEVENITNPTHYEENSTNVSISTASKMSSQIPSHGSKINTIANSLICDHTPEIKPFIDHKVASGSQKANSLHLTYSNDHENGPVRFLFRTNSVPTTIHRDIGGVTQNACLGDIFSTFPSPVDRHGFPNYTNRYAASNVNILPQHQLSYGTSVGGLSQGSSLFDSSGEFLPGFHALMCAGFVTMPRTQVLQSIKCDAKKWEYIQQTLHNAFRKFPYLTATEVQVLSNLTELTCQQVKTLFAVARLQHGISWDQEEIQNARNYLRIPGNRFCGDG